jgi:hypothetical protein
MRRGRREAGMIIKKVTRKNLVVEKLFCILTMVLDTGKLNKIVKN